MVTDSRTLHHYWSHSDVTPWSADGRLLLSQRADVAEMQAQLDGSQARLTQQIGFTNFTEGALLLCLRAALAQVSFTGLVNAPPCSFTKIWQGINPHPSCHCRLY